MIFVTGDTHGGLDIKKLSSKNFKEQKSLTKEDYVIICGDFGLTWDKSKVTKANLKLLEGRNFTTLWIDGNHENFDLLKEYDVEEWNGGKVQKISNSVIHLMRGQIYNICGKTIFTMGGAASIDKDYRIPSISWWPEEVPSYKEISDGLNNLEKANWKVDYIITHDCSNSILKKLNIRVCDLISDRGLKKSFEIIEDKCAFSHWYFGHHHIDKEVDAKHTALYNTIIRIF